MEGIGDLSTQQKMLEIEIINATLDWTAISTSSSDNKNSYSPDTICVIKLFSKEIARTSPCYNSAEPVWSEKFVKTYNDLVTREKVYQRPFYLETLQIEIVDAHKSSDRNSVLFEARVPITNVGTFKSYRLIKCANSTETSKLEYHNSINPGNIFIRMNLLANDFLSSTITLARTQLCEALPSWSPMYRHLYLNWSFSPNSFSYSGGLPGPACGELIIDKYNNVEVTIILS